MKRVVATGIGSVSPTGNSFRQSWDAMNEGSTGIGQITRVKNGVTRFMKDLESMQYL
jgi:3-oxoacyl-(acyl-carrier-protein) synthase